MATSKVGIANRALQLLGASRVESLSQDNPNARSMNAAFIPVRDALFRRYDWSFAIKRASVAADATQTTWGGLNRYALPADFARLLRDDESARRVDWKIEGQHIITADAAPLEFRYVAVIDDPTHYDVMFVELLAITLASETCEEITQSTSRLQSLDVRRALVLKESRQMNTFERGPTSSLDDDWLRAVN